MFHEINQQLFLACLSETDYYLKCSNNIQTKSIFT